MRRMGGGDVIGFDVTRVQDWLSTVTDVEPPLTVDAAGGWPLRSLTYLLQDSAEQELVIRRPPQGTLLPKAHDMWREYRIIHALWPTPVPVAEPIAYCDDPDVAETHFYVMGRRPGQALHDQQGAAAWLHGDARQRAGEALAEVLAALHGIDPAEVGLADLGRPDGYVSRQLKTWYSSWVAQRENAQLDDRRVHDLHDLLSARIPQQGPARIVHGDYGPHNVLFDQGGEITAVLDWEIATLGDPLADLGYTLNTWVGPSDEPVDVREPAMAISGFVSRQEVLTRYVELTGADTSNLGYYRAFNLWKRACILQGVYARYRSGQKDAEAVRLEVLTVRIDQALRVAVDLMAEAFSA